MTSETEFKFAIPSTAHPQAQAYFDGSDHSELESTYFDTADLDLRSAEIDLRIRKDGHRLIQTIKRASTQSGAFTREEHEIEVSERAIDREHLAPLLPLQIRDKIDANSLSPQYVTRFTRHKRMIPEADPVVEAVFDIGEIVVNGSSQPISEVEFELQGTDAGAMAKVCLDFLKQVPAELAIESKSARGFRLAHGTEPRAVKARIPRIAPATHLPDAILTLLRAGFAQFVGNIPAVRESSTPKSIHQMRVGIRRFRSALSAFRSVLSLDGAQDLIVDLKSLFKLLGDVRNADVFLTETLPGISEPLLTAGIREELERATVTYREKTLARVQTRLASPKFARFVVRLATWIETAGWMRNEQPLDRLLIKRTARDFAETRLDRLHRKLLKKGRKARREGIIVWHEARIAAKKLRYTTEPLISALGAPEAETKAYTKSLKVLQATLGRLNDLETARQFSAALVDEVSEPERPQLIAAHQLLLSWASRREGELLEEVSDTFDTFEKIALPGLMVDA